MTDRPGLAQQWSRWAMSNDLKMFVFLFPAIPAGSWLVAAAYQGSAEIFDGGGWIFAVALVALIAGLVAVRGATLDDTVPRADFEDLQERLAALEQGKRDRRHHAG